MFISLINAAAGRRLAILMTAFYGTNMVTMSKEVISDSILATYLIQYCQQDFALDRLSMLFKHCFSILMLAFKYKNCHFKYHVAGFYKIHNTLSEHKIP